MGNRLSSINIVTGASNLIKANILVNLNAIGYNTLDNLIYGIATGTNQLYVVDSNGNIGNLGRIENLPLPAVSYEIGTIDGNGHLFISETNSNKLYTIDVNSGSSNYLKLVDPALGFALDTAPYGTTLSQNINITDWAIKSDDGFLYSVNSSGQVIRINQFTGVVTTLTTTGLPVSSYGPIYSFADGYIYGTNNTTGNIYRIEITGNNASALLFSTDAITTSNDGASCLNAPVNTDYGDAPDAGTGTSASNYRTLLIDNGPRHGDLGVLRLGNNITFETDGYQNSTATGDDISEGIQDDGTTVPLVSIINTNNSYSFVESVINNTGSNANIYAWLDWNQDGIFQTDEGVSAIVPSAAGIQNISLNLTAPYPVPIQSGTTFLRVRLTSDNLINTGGISSEDTRSFGPASNGEVEDYALDILNINKTVDKAYAETSEILTYTVTIEDSGLLGTKNLFFQDTTPNGTTYNNNLFVSSIYTGANPNSGLTILNINPGETVTISWEVIVGNSIPIPNPILNTGNVTPSGGVTTNTNTVSTLVNMPNISINKSVDKVYAQVSEELVYTTVITNIGTINLDNVIFTDSPPLETSFIPNTLTINGVLQPSVYPSGNIDLGPLAVSNSVTVSYRVLIPSLPSPPEIHNVSTATYEYTLGPGEPTRSKTKDSNEVVTYVVLGLLSITKYVDKSVAELGDTLLYTIVLRNEGNVLLTNVVLTDVIPLETTFVAGSVSVNGVNNPLGNPASGINVGSIDIYGTSIVTFLVTIDRMPASGQIINNSSATYNYIVDPNNPSLTGSVTSNNVITVIYEVNVSIEKVVDKAQVSVLDVITYYFVVRNNGTVDINNFIFKDQIPEGTLYVNNSFKVNGAVILNGNPVIGVNIGTIVSGGYKNVSFSVTVTKVPCTKVFTNCASGTYGYNVPNSTEVANGAVNSNCVSTEVISNIFKQLYVDGDFKIPDIKPDIEDVIDFTINIEMCEFNIIDVIDGVSNEGQIINGRKLRICGNILGKLEYVGLLAAQSVHFAHINIPFCTYMIVDSSINECNFCPKIKDIEDLYFTKIDNRTIFANITFMIEI